MQARQFPTLQALSFQAVLSNAEMKINSEDFHPLVRSKIMEEFLQAVVDNDRDKVARFLSYHPELLLIEPTPYVTDDFIIQSKLTWQIFHAEDALTMAVKRKQLKMIKLLLSYYDKLDQTEEVLASKHKSLSAWQPYPIKKYWRKNDEIDIPRDYIILAQSLIEIFKSETFPHSVPRWEHDKRYVELSEKTESALASLLDFLVPKVAVTLDQRVDEELFLLALYKEFDKQIDVSSQDQDVQRFDTFCTRVIGLTQSAIAPETAEFFCRGLFYEMVKINGVGVAISDHATEYKLKTDSIPFYRASRDLRSGMGFDYSCEPNGYILNSPFNVYLANRRRLPSNVFEKVMLIKNRELEKLLRPKLDQGQSLGDWVPACPLM